MQVVLIDGGKAVKQHPAAHDEQSALGEAVSDDVSRHAGERAVIEQADAAHEHPDLLMLENASSRLMWR